MNRKLPALSPRKVVRALTRAGFELVRVRGSHHYFFHPERHGLVVVVPMHASDVKRGTLANIIAMSGLTEEEFLALL
jgi:predicted RNA binding protein YcfA (HicA-like mRNA interferase family)